MKRRYQSETIDFILKLLEDIEDQGGRYRTLIALYEDEIVQSILYLLERENISLDEITRTELKPKIREVLKEADDKINRALNDFFWIGINVVSEDLLRNGQLSYNFASSLVSKNFQTKDIYTMLQEKYLQKPWSADGKTYQVRLFGHVINLSAKIKYILEDGIMNGRGLEWLEKNWKCAFQTMANEGVRLLRTESMALNTEIEQDLFLYNDIRYVEIINPVACSAICIDYVDRIVDLTSASISDELPPYHPNCMCCFYPIEEEDEDGFILGM